MKIDFASDLHFEFGPLDSAQLSSMAGGDILLLAGDTITAKDIHRAARRDNRRWYNFQTFMDEASKRYKRVFAVGGNHEAYGYNISESAKAWKSAAKLWPNVQYLDDETVELRPGLQLFGGTLWTDMNKGDPGTHVAVGHGMNDFQGSIKMGQGQRVRRFTTDAAAKRFKATMRALDKSLKAHPTDEFLVMTHHCPDKCSCDTARFGEGPLNYGYFSDLSYWIGLRPRIKNWVCGHTHKRTEYTIAQCDQKDQWKHIVCTVRMNGRGYAMHDPAEPSFRFDRGFTV